MMSGMRFVIDPDPRRFAEVVGPFLDGRIGCNILATILLGVLEGGSGGPSPVMARGVDAPAGTAAAIAAAWVSATGGSTQLRTRMAFHALEAVTDPPPDRSRSSAAGRLGPD